MTGKAQAEKQLHEFEQALGRVECEKSVGRTAQMDRLLGMQQVMYILTRFLDHADAQRFTVLFEAAWARVAEGRS